MALSKEKAENVRSVMLDEILEQPAAIRRTLQHYRDPGELLSQLEPAFAHRDRLVISASGSSRHAGLAGEVIIEDLCTLAVDVEYASEYLYRTAHSILFPALMVISQSGETADTLSVLRQGKAHKLLTLAITNVAGSSMMIEADLAFLTHAGRELAIPATKSFTSQLVMLQLLALAIGRIRKSSADLQRAHACLKRLPELVSTALPAWQQQANEIAQRYQDAKAFMLAGRGVHYAIAREGALKLKETAYRQAEAYPAGEIRHGPQALVSPQVPAVIIATHDPEDEDSVLRYRKTLEIARELRAKGGEVIALVNEGDLAAEQLACCAIEVPVSNEYGLAVLEVIPLQLLACYFALNDGIDPDRPRNLSKAVLRK
jgi:glucosamine--fructose-6-phosphate aminotransferase (isomerizing)